MTRQQHLLMSYYEVGDRIEISPALDAWMQGDRYGEIVAKGHTYLHTKMDRSGKTRMIHPDNVFKKV